jgi:lipooligosaccharide transport system permease protein
MERQKTYLAIASTPISIEEVVLGEAIWGTVMGMLSAFFCLTVNFFLPEPWSYPAMLRIFACASLGAFVASSLALFFTSRARGYEDFTIYFTLILTPMSALSGAYFPTSNFPGIASLAAKLVPASYAVTAARSSIWTIGPEVLILLAWGAPLLYFAVKGISKRVVGAGD